MPKLVGLEKIRDVELPDNGCLAAVTLGVPTAVTGARLIENVRRNRYVTNRSLSQRLHAVL
jgi:hypothetical protein